MCLKTSQEWQEIHSDVKVLDPDGWDRKNYEYSWKQEKISESEYFYRRSESSCMFMTEDKNND